MEHINRLLSPDAHFTCSGFHITDLKITQFLKRLSEMNLSLTEKSEESGDDHHPDMPSQRELVDETVDEVSSIQSLARTMLKHVWKE